VLDLVTFSADIRLGCCLAHRILHLMHLVTVSAGDVVSSMSTRHPVMRRVRLVTTEAHGILFCDRRAGLRSKVDDAGRLPPLRLGVRTARAVTGLALQPAVSERAMQVIGEGMPGPEDRHDLGFVVTIETGVSTLRAVCSRKRLFGRDILARRSLVG
jgi:hypothetical protein